MCYLCQMSTQNDPFAANNAPWVPPAPNPYTQPAFVVAPNNILYTNSNSNSSTPPAHHVLVANFHEVFEFIYDPATSPSNWLQRRPGHLVALDVHDYLKEMLGHWTTYFHSPSSTASFHDAQDFITEEFAEAVYTGTFEVWYAPTGAVSTIIWTPSAKPTDIARANAMLLGFIPGPHASGPNFVFRGVNYTANYTLPPSKKATRQPAPTTAPPPSIFDQTATEAPTQPNLTGSIFGDLLAGLTPLDAIEDVPPKVAVQFIDKPCYQCDRVLVRAPAGQMGLCKSCQGAI